MELLFNLIDFLFIRKFIKIIVSIVLLFVLASCKGDYDTWAA